MSIDDVCKITSVVFNSVGSVAIIMFVLSLFGKIFAGKILEADRVRYQSELEVIKRYSEKQFHLYSDLWSSLCDLRIGGDSLWERAIFANARRFAGQLKKTEDQVKRSSLLIEDGHYESLRKLMEEFGKFQVGKATLIDLRNSPNHDHGVNDTDIKFAIEANSATKEKYSKLLTELESSFKRQMRGTK
jgi:hypothetical protein